MKMCHGYKGLLVDVRHTLCMVICIWEYIHNVPHTFIFFGLVLIFVCYNNLHHLYLIINFTVVHLLKIIWQDGFFFFYRREHISLFSHKPSSLPASYSTHKAVQGKKMHILGKFLCHNVTPKYMRGSDVIVTGPINWPKRLRETDQENMEALVTNGSTDTAVLEGIVCHNALWKTCLANVFFRGWILFQESFFYMFIKLYFVLRPTTCGHSYQGGEYSSCKRARHRKGVGCKNPKHTPVPDDMKKKHKPSIQNQSNRSQQGNAEFTGCVCAVWAEPREKGKRG